MHKLWISVSALLGWAQKTMFDFVLIGDSRRELPLDDSNSDRLCCRGLV